MAIPCQDGNRKEGKLLSGIYCIFNEADRRMYIGSTNNFARRKSEHISALKHGRHSNKHLQLAYISGDARDFQFIELVRCNREEASLLEEKVLTDLYSSGLLYNSSPYASGGGNQARMCKMREKIVHRGRTGVPVSINTRAKMSKAHTGGKRSAQTKSKMSERNANNVKIRVYGKVYRSMSQAASMLGISRTTINSRVNSDNFPDYSREP
jgi:group I intron endonuclease